MTVGKFNLNRCVGTAGDVLVVGDKRECLCADVGGKTACGIQITKANVISAGSLTIECAKVYALLPFFVGWNTIIIYVGKSVAYRGQFRLSRKTSVFS